MPHMCLCPRLCIWICRAFHFISFHLARFILFHIYVSSLFLLSTYSGLPRWVYLVQEESQMRVRLIMRAIQGGEEGDVEETEGEMIEAK